MPPFIDFTGKRFGRLIAIKRQDMPKYKGASWLCRCDCGNDIIVRGQSLKQDHTKSCGCLNKDQKRQICIDRNFKHGHSSRDNKSRVYKIWCNMMQRCYSPSQAYSYCGVKDTKVCDKWFQFENFLSDMGNPPTSKHTLDRIDNSKGYSPDNCQWATMKEQQNNRTNNHLIEHEGRTMTLQGWSEVTGIGRSTIAHRLKHGWPVSKALTVRPAKGRNQYK